MFSLGEFVFPPCELENRGSTPSATSRRAWLSFSSRSVLHVERLHKKSVTTSMDKRHKMGLIKHYRKASSYHENSCLNGRRLYRMGMVVDNALLGDQLGIMQRGFVLIAAR